jgi:hypothetical protein
MQVGRDVAISRLAAERYGVFTRRHATTLGFSPRMIQHRLQTARWEALHPGVYMVSGTPGSWHRDQMAACDWSGGVSAGKAAGHLFGLPACQEPPVEVITTFRHKVMPHGGVIAHATKRLPPEQLTVVQGIPATCIERTLMSLCVQLSRRDCAIALDNALFRGLTSVGAIDHCLFRTARQGRGGSRLLRELTQERVELDQVPNTPLETVIFELLVAGGVPLPELQHEIFDQQGNFVARPDFFFPGPGLILEGHSKLWHTGALATKRDALREERLKELGYRIVYVTWTDATRYSEQTVAHIRRLLKESPFSRCPERAPVLLS